MENDEMLKIIWKRLTWIISITLSIVALVAIYLAAPLSNRVSKVEKVSSEHSVRISVVEANESSTEKKLDDHILEQRIQFRDMNKNIKDGFREVKELIKERN